MKDIENKVKWTRTKQFNKFGRRRELTSIILTAGCVTNYDFQVLGDKRYYNVYIKRMKDEGLLKEIKLKDTHKTYRIFCFKNYLEDKKILEKFYDKYTLNYYDSKRTYLQNTLSEGMNRQRLIRNVRRSHVVSLMSKTYIRVLTDDIDKLSILNEQDKISKYDAVFFPLEDIKTNLSAVSNSRAVGLLMTPSETYTVYDLMTARIEWSNTVEDNVLGLSYWSDQKYRPEGYNAPKDNNALLISEIDPVVKMLQETERTRARRKYNLIELPVSSFKKVYWIPASEDGAKMMQIVSEPNWEREMVKKLKSQYDPVESTWLIHHATEGENKYVYFFCIADLNEFKKFISQSAEYLDKLKFKIVCFDFQKEFLERVLDSRYEIEVVDVNNFM